MKRSTLTVSLASLLLTFATVQAHDAVEANTVVQVLKSNQDLSTFIQAASVADIAQILQEHGPFTIFAPNDAAFKKLPPGTWQDLLKPQNKQKLRDFLGYHVVPGTLFTQDFQTGKIKTINGKELSISVKDDVITVDNVKIVKGDIEGSNGVIHVIDAVLLP